MRREIGVCRHLDGLEPRESGIYCCPLCGERLDFNAVARWVREAERERDDSYSEPESEEFERIMNDELQREVYRRRRVLYELQDATRRLSESPEMLLVIHDPQSGGYDCRIFYKSSGGASGNERLVVEGDEEAIWGLRSHEKRSMRRVAERLGEFHAARQEAIRRGERAPTRRVFYAHEL